MSRKCYRCGSDDVSVALQCRVCGSYNTKVWEPREEKPDGWDEVTPVADLIEREEVIDFKITDNYFTLFVRPYGNCRWFSDLSDYPNGNISTEQDYGDWNSVIKVNIRR